MKFDINCLARFLAMLDRADRRHYIGTMSFTFVLTFQMIVELLVVK